VGKTRQNWLRGDNVPDVVTAHEISTLLKVPIDSFFSGGTEDAAVQTELKTIRRQIQEMRKLLDFMYQRGKI
jgi:transcriptional regulator with XRE-family HTH domain